MRLACITSDLTRVLWNIFVIKYQKLNIKFWLSPSCRPGMRRFMLGNANFLHIRNRNLSTDPLMPWIPKVHKNLMAFHWTIRFSLHSPSEVLVLTRLTGWLLTWWQYCRLSISRSEIHILLTPAQGKWNVLLCLSTNERTVSQCIWTNESAAISC